MLNLKPKKMTQEENIKFLLSYCKSSKLEEYKNLKLITHKADIRGEEKPALKVFKGKQKNPYINYFYITEESRAAAINKAKEYADKEQERKEQIKAERKAFTPDFKVGDIFYTSWGYEQTNVEFYQVVEKPSAHYAIIQEIAQENVPDSMESHGMSCSVMPIKDKFISEKIERRKVGKYGISFSSYRSAFKWDGQPKYKSWYY